MSIPKPNSLERLVPSELLEADSTGQETLRLHLARYHFAASRIKGGRVLDCACGVGYGSRLLAREAPGSPVVTGVDIDADAIAYAQESYGADGLSFVCADGAMFDSEPFDAVVSFETIEHVPDPDALVGNLSRLLKPGGSFIASVPITPSVDVNPYHLHDFSKSSFLEMFKRHALLMTDAIVQVQKYDPLKMLRGKEARLSDMRKGLPAYYAAHPAAFFRRFYSTVVDGFCNKYLVAAFEKRA